MVNDDRHGNAKMKKLLVDGKPHLCLFATKHIGEGDQLFFDYGDDVTRLYWRKKVTSCYFAHAAMRLQLKECHELRRLNLIKMSDLIVDSWYS